MIYFVYRTTNLANDDFYIGVHKGSVDDSYLGSGYRFRRSVKKYGRVNFKREILKIFDDEQTAYDYERELVNDDLLSNPKCLNIAIGGFGGCRRGTTWQQATAQKMGLSNKGRKHSEESRQNIANAQRGSTRSDETKRKMSESSKGKPKSKEWRAKISASKIGQKESDETRRKKSDAHKALKKDMALMRGKHYDKVACPHCDKSGGLNLMKRYHFDNCKHREINETNTR